MGYGANSKCIESTIRMGILVMGMYVAKSYRWKGLIVVLVTGPAVTGVALGWRISRDLAHHPLAVVVPMLAGVLSVASLIAIAKAVSPETARSRPVAIVI